MNTDKILTMDNIEIGKTIQRNLNSIWESKVIKYINDCSNNKMNYNYKQLNSLIVSYLNVEKTMIYLANSFNLKIEVDVAIMKGKYTFVPRRFKVVLRRDNKTNHDTICNKLEKVYGKDIYTLISEGFGNIRMIKEAYALPMHVNTVYRLTSPKTNNEKLFMLDSVSLVDYKKCYNFKSVDSDLSFTIPEDKLDVFNVEKVIEKK